MPYRVLPRIAAVKPTGRPFVLAVIWQDGSEVGIDISAPIRTFRHFAPLRDDPAMFEKAAVGEWGSHVVWPGEIEIAATTLSRLHQEVL